MHDIHFSIIDDVDKVDVAAADVMTTSMYQKNGEESHLNGAASSAAATATANPDPASSSLKCLEEPSFEFEASKETVAKKSEVKKPSYRVLEDPYEVTASAPSKPKASPNYRVLEDPMTTAMYDPSTSSEAAAATAMTRPLASEVLEGAREKFDKFWGSKTRPANPDSATNEP